MTIYEKVKTAVSNWCLINNFEAHAETATREDGSTPQRYLLYSVISDNGAAHFDNAETIRRYRIQFDMVAPMVDMSLMFARLIALENAIKTYGFRPQGNYHMETDRETGLVWIQKDYMVRMEAADIGLT